MEWIQVVKDVGVPIAALVFIGWCAVKAGRWIADRGSVVADWIGREIVIQFRDRFLRRLETFFDRTEAGMGSLLSDTGTVRTHMEKQTGLLEEHREILDELRQQGCGHHQQEQQRGPQGR